MRIILGVARSGNNAKTYWMSHTSILDAFGNIVDPLENHLGNTNPELRYYLEILTIDIIGISQMTMS